MEKYSYGCVPNHDIIASNSTYKHIISICFYVFNLSDIINW